MAASVWAEPAVTWRRSRLGIAIVEGWQLGGIFSWNSGAPLVITMGGTPNPFQILPNTNNFPDLVGDFPKGSGKVTVTSTPGRVTYFEGFTRLNDPGRSSITTAQNLQAANAQFAIAKSDGSLVLANPAIGRIGNLGQNWIEGRASSVSTPTCSSVFGSARRRSSRSASWPSTC
jgi:hypothetical protein